MKVMVVDGTNLLFRAQKAAERDVQLSVEIEGEQINTAGVYLFIRVLTKYVREEAPHAIVVAWDGGRSTYRTGIYPAYKEHRLDDPGKDLRPFDLAKEFLTLSGIHHVEMPGVEADDIVAGYARKLQGQDVDVVMLSGDKDFLQLVGPRVSQIRPKVKPEKWGVAEVKEKYGVMPEDLPYMMALTGDASDGVPGIPGFGEKTALKFLTKYDFDLDALIHSDEPKVAERGEDILRNLYLVDLRNELTEAIAGQLGGIKEFFDPVTLITYPELMEWLKLYRMDSVLRELQAGTLWKQPKQEVLL